MNNKRIFCFWEPPERMPAYLKLCMRTWQKNFPDYEIVLLNYSNIEKWLPPEVLDVAWVKRYGIAAQTDAFRVALMAHHGGIWFDVDTIVTTGRAHELLDGVDKLTMFGSHMGCLSAPANDPFAKMWHECIKRRIERHKWYRATRPWWIQGWQFVRRAHRFGPGPVLFRRWDYMGNAALRNISVRNGDLFHKIDRVAVKVLPEVLVFPPPKFDGRAAYLKYYFDPQYADQLVADSMSGGGLVMLHNGWTPKEIKKMSEREFLDTGFPMARLLSRILEQ